MDFLAPVFTFDVRDVCFATVILLGAFYVAYLLGKSAKARENERHATVDAARIAEVWRHRSCPHGPN